MNDRKREEKERSRVPVVDKRVSSRGEEEPPPPDPAVEATKLAEERLDQLLRLKADFENLKKRMIRDQTEVVERASLRIVERLLPVLDDLERALEAARKHEPSEEMVRGIELVHAHLHQVLIDEGLERVEAEGAFDPHEHEAVSTVHGDVDEPTVLEVVRPGYKLKGRTIRPALVHVTTPEHSDERRSSESAGGPGGAAPPGEDGGA